jgi:hypothetical protein
VFAEPTIKDFLARIDWHIGKALDRAARGVSDVRQQFAAAGGLNSGRAVIFSVEAARMEFDSGIEAVLGELKRVLRTTKLDRHELRQHAVQRLMNFTKAAKAAAQTPEASSLGMNQNVDAQFAAFDQHLQFSVRQFDVGFPDPAEPEVPAVANNSINIGSMTGSTIQQGSSEAKQSVQFMLNIEPVRAALTAFESAIKGTPNLPATTLDELLADVHTIRAELSKPSPTLSIIQEAGRSIRSVMEGADAEITTPTAIAAANAIVKAVGAF